MARSSAAVASVRGLARRATFITFGVTLLLTATLALRTLLVSDATTRVEDAAATSAVAPQLEADFRAYERLSWLYGETFDPRVEQQRMEILDDLRDELAFARHHSDATRGVMLTGLQAALDDYVQQRDRLAPDAREHSFDRVARRLSEFRSAGDVALLAAQRRSMISNSLALLVGVLSLFAVSFTLWFFLKQLRRDVLLPLENFSETIRSLGEGESKARVTEALPLELKQAACAFNQLADALERQRQNELAYLAAVAHDLRNPLAALKTGVAIVEKRAGKADTSKATFTAINRQIDRLSRMIGDLLDMVRIEAGKLELRRERVDLRALVRDQVQFYRPTTDKHELVSHVPDVPAISDCDPMRVEQLLGNLIINAIKYSPRGGRVDVRLELEPDAVVISVADEGVGMPKDALEQIFAPFWRRRMSGRVEGAGLGLSVVRRIVEAHGGRIEVESELQLGSTFRVRLPRAAALTSTTDISPAALDA